MYIALESQVKVLADELVKEEEDKKKVLAAQPNQDTTNHTVSPQPEQAEVKPVTPLSGSNTTPNVAPSVTPNTAPAPAPSTAPAPSIAPNTAPHTATKEPLEVAKIHVPPQHGIDMDLATLLTSSIALNANSISQF